MTAKTRKIIKIISIILAIILLFAGAVFTFIKIGEAKLRKNLSLNDDGLSQEDAYGDYAEVFYNGKAYIYNENLINILCIGVDKENIGAQHDRQADALYLLSFDTVNDKVNVLAISRNTLADIDIYDMNNEFLSTDRAQICLSYVYGKDDEHSSNLTTKAVSRLLYDIPINSYCTFFTDSIAEVVDTIGGVTVTIPDDMTEVSPSWKKGAKVALNSKNTMNFIRYRKDSNQVRVNRQMIFLEQFSVKVKTAIYNDWSLPMKLFKKLSSSTVTSINSTGITYLATEAVTSEFVYHTIKGENGFDGTYETFTVDDKSLYEMVLNLFYINKN